MLIELVKMHHLIFYRPQIVKITCLEVIVLLKVVVGVLLYLHVIR